MCFMYYVMLLNILKYIYFYTKKGIYDCMNKCTYKFIYKKLKYVGIKLQ